MEKATDEELVKHDAATHKHIEQVQAFMNMLIGVLHQSALDHDHSKFCPMAPRSTGLFCVRCSLPLGTIKRPTVTILSTTMGWQG